MPISEFIDQSLKAVTISELLSFFRQALGELGYPYIMLAALGEGWRDADIFARQERSLPPPLLWSSFPRLWQDYYYGRNAQHHDPVLLYGPRCVRPFFWHELPAKFALTRPQQTILRAAETYGLRQGVGVPIHGPGRSVFLVSCAGKGGEEKAQGRSREAPEERVLSRLYLLTVQFHRVLRILHPIEPPPQPVPDLTSRERECLEWIARGKSTWGIGVVLGISEHTAKCHIRNALRKLAATNRTEGVIKALHLGLLE
ncbi:LuxR family transcriptional regulator [Luteithermobacter gelatinilyticus]|uniref:LuxR family transcriptional regulator n=1 Tax=Luteithermobacter gelatinilyticus TaxID=2582913 RepID=UPI001105B48E|nr:LuxR family transcriptional regulator [Luteithermobacter gelatinilyticus]|tara:strand:- start:489 stop:1259 length:771 start_codon:yes stop_codon:yes gene_type:complete